MRIVNKHTSSATRANHNKCEHDNGNWAMIDITTLSISIKVTTREGKRTHAFAWECLFLFTIMIKYGTNIVKTIARRKQGMHTVGAESETAHAPLLRYKSSPESAKRQDQLPPERMGVSLSNNRPPLSSFRHFSFSASSAAAFATFCSCARRSASVWPWHWVRSWVVF
jgi:hypothetical protein